MSKVFESILIHIVAKRRGLNKIVHKVIIGICHPTFEFHVLGKNV